MMENYWMERPDPSEQKPEKREHLEHMLDLLVNKYVDSEGNILHYKAYQLITDDDFVPVFEALNIENIDEITEYDDQMLVQLAEIIKNKISESSSILQKIILIKILSDLLKEHPLDAVLSAMQNISENSRDSYFVQSFARNYYVKERKNKRYILAPESVADIDEQLAPINAMHDHRFNGYYFEFDDEMLEKLVLDNGCDYGTPSQARDSSEIWPRHLVHGVDGDYHKGDYITSMIAPDVLGIFSNQGHLVAWQEVDTLAEPDTETKNKKINRPDDVLLIKNKINFNNSTEDFALFKILSSLDFRYQLGQDLNIDLSDFDLRTQYQFLTYIKNHSSADMEKLKSFVSSVAGVDDRQNRIKAFLCLEIDYSDGDKIVELGTRFPTPATQVLFQKIAELNSLASQEDLDLSKKVFEDKQLFELNNARAKLLAKAHRLVAQFSQELTPEKEIDDDQLSSLLQELERNKTEISVLAAVLKSALEQNKDTSLADLRNIDLSIGDYGEEISSADQSAIMAIAEENWRQNPKLQKQVISELKKDLQKSAVQKGYILRYNNEIIGFIRFEDLGQGEVYAGSLNIHDELHGLKIGEAFMEKSLSQEAQNNVLHATASPRIKAISYYLENLGFVIDGLIDDYHATGEPLFTISLDRATNNNYAFKEGEKKTSMDLEKAKSLAQGAENLDELIGQPSFVLSFDLTQDFDAHISVMKKLLATKKSATETPTGPEVDRYIVTRCLREKKDSKRDVRYFVFEKIS